MSGLFAYPERVDNLRIPREDDAPAVLRAVDDERTKRFLASIPDDVTEDFARAWCGADAERIRAEHGARYVAVDPVTGAVLAGVTLKRAVPERRQAEIGYWVAPEARGKGIATQAVRTATAAGFAAGLGRIELLAEHENPVSQKVSLAAGFRREGVRHMPSARGRGAHEFVVYARMEYDDGEPIPRRLPDLPDGRLTDGVVTLRPLATTDVDDIHHLLHLPEVAATSFGDTSYEHLQRKCAQAESHWLAGSRADMVIIDAATGAFAGDIGFWYLSPGLREGMIGYSLLPEFRGRGLATRAVNLIARWTFDHVGVARLVAGTAPENEGSQRVLQRAGFVREAYMRARLPGHDGGRLDDIQWLRLPEKAAGNG